MACDCGWFDQSTECLGEQFVNITNGGAVSTMLNARYGWGAPPCMGPNENMNCAFFHNYLAGMTQGRAHGLARDLLRNESFSQMTARWAMYTNTLQGDPTMMMWRRVPETLAVVLPDSVPATPQTLPVTVSCGDGAVFGARVAITHVGELVARATTNSTGIAYVPLSGVGDTWTLGVTVTAQDARVRQGVIHAKAGGTGPLVTFLHSRVDDPNGRLDPGDFAEMYLVVENRGDAAADSVFGMLTSLSPYVTVLDSASAYGTLAAGDTAPGEAYRVLVGPNCPHGQFTLATAAGSDTWRSAVEAVVGVPNARGGIWANMDTGDYCLSVCANGGVGTTWWRGEGYGFIYPKARQWSAASMMHGSFMLGTDTSWVCDNYYGAPAWQVCPQDFAMQESVRTVYPPELGSKELIAAFTDAHHPEPKNLRIVHRAYGSANPNHKDFVVLEYRIFNEGTTALENLHAAVACDFRTPGWNVNDSFDYAGTDSLRNLAYVKSASSGETLALGIRHVYPPAWPGFANCINEWTYVANGFTKPEKMGFMDGTLRSTTGTTRANWDGMSSSGPYEIAAGDSQIVAFVLCGARTVAQLQTVSDTAALWYNPPVGVEEKSEVRRVSCEVFPRVFTGGLTVRYALDRIEPIVVGAYDAGGRLVGSYRHEPAASTGSFTWRPALTPGVYFVRVAGRSDKVVKIE
jgi:hypothetical protein